MVGRVGIANQARGRHHRWFSSAVGLTGIAVVLATLQAPAVAGEPGGPTGTAAGVTAAAKDDPVTEAEDRTTAAALARQQGVPVEVLDERTATSSTFVNPDGSSTAEEANGPERVEQADGTWKDVDLTLVSDGQGNLVPRVSPTQVSISAGGTTSAATITLPGGATIGAGWLSKLPAPTVEGGVATYALSGNRQLVITTTPGGFNARLVLLAPPAGGDAAVFRLPVRANKIDLSQDTNGDLVVTSKAGKELARARSFTAWDSTVDAAGDPVRVVPLSASLDRSGDTPVLQLQAPAGFLTDPATKYPVTIDPDISALTITGDMYVYTGQTSTTSQDAKMVIGTYDSGDIKHRAFIEFNSNPILGKHVTAASLKLFQYYAITCAAKQVKVYPTTAGQNGSTIWSNQPGVVASYLVTKSFNHGYEGGGCSNGFESIDVASILQAWASEAIEPHSLSLRAGSETDNSYEKRFCAYNYDPTHSSCNTANRVPKLSVTYNTVPATPTAPTVTPKVSSYVNTTTPGLSATVSDPDTGTLVHADFEIYSGSTLVWSGSSADVTTSGATSPVTVSSGVLTNGTTYTLRAYSADGIDRSAAYASTSFTVDTAAPAAPTISCPSYPAGTWSTLSGTSTTCSLSSTATDQTGFTWSLDGPNPPATSVTAAAGTNATVSVPLSAGQHTVFARTIDRAGNASTTTSYSLKLSSAPNAPRHVVPTPLDASIRVTWEEPRDNGGLPITGYALTVTPGGTTVTVTGDDANPPPLTATVTGLTNGTSYTVTVKATNATGTGPQSAAAGPVTPSKLAQAVSKVTTLAGDGTTSTHPGAGVAAGLNAPTATATATGLAGTYVYIGGPDYLATIEPFATGVSVLAGAPGTQGCADGTSVAARFKPALDLAADTNYVYSTSDCGLRRTSRTDGATSTLTLSGTTTSITYITAADDGYLYGTRGGTSGAVYKIDPATGATTTLTTVPGGCGGSTAWGLTAQGGNLYVQERDITCGLDLGSKHLVKVTRATGTASVLLGDDRMDTNASIVATASTAFVSMRIPVCTGTGCPGTATLYGPRVVGVDIASGLTRFLAGSSSGYADGTGTDAWLSEISDLATDGTNLYVADTGNNRIRKVSDTQPWTTGQPAAVNAATPITYGRVSNLAGSSTGTSIAGTGTSAGFNTPTAVTYVESQRSIYVGTADTIMRVDPTTRVTTIVAGVAGSPGFIDASSGGSARVASVTSLVNDGHDLYFLQAGKVRRLTLSTGALSTFAALNAPGDSYTQITIAADGSIIALDSHRVISRIDPTSGARVQLVGLQSGGCMGFDTYGLAADSATLWVAGANLNCSSEPGKPQIRSFSLATGDALTTLTPTDNRDIMQARGNVVLAGAGAKLYLAYGGRWWNDAVNNCWPLQIFAIDKTTGNTSVVLGGTAPESGIPVVNDGTCRSDTDGSGTGGTFAGMSQMVSDGTALYAVEGSYGNQLRVINTAPLPGGTGPLSAQEHQGGCACSEINDGVRSCGDPVDPDSGHYFETVHDLNLSGRGPAIDFNRTYDSSAASIDGPLGYGWVDSYGWQLSVDASGGPTNGQVSIQQFNGSVTMFAPDGSGGYVAAPRVLATLVKNADGTWTYTVKKTQTYTFSATGKLTSISDLNGYHTDMSYDSSGRLKAITDHAGRQLTIGYDSASRIHTVTDPLSRAVTYDYNAAGELHTVIDVDGRTWTYGYGTSHRLTSITDPRGNAVNTHYDATTGQVDWQDNRRGKRTTFTYGATAPGGYHTTLVTHPRGNQDQYVYYDGLVVQETQGYGTAAAGTWAYSYDPDIRAVTATTDPDGHTSSATYDERGNQTSTTDGLGYRTSTSYNVFNEPLRVTDANNVRTTYSYDANGNQLSVSTPLVGSSPAQVEVTTYTYGDAGHPGDVTAVTDPVGKTTTFTYDAYGDVASSTDPTGRKTTHTYNAAGWLISDVLPAGNVTGGTPSQHQITYSNFTGFGKPKTVTDPLGHATTYGYDAAQNLTDTTDADGRTTHTDFNPEGQPILVTRPGSVAQGSGYDDNGNLATQTDGLSHVTSYGYDAQDRLTSTTDALGRVTGYGYDTAGNRTMLTQPGPGGSSLTTTYTYDAVNQLIGVDYSDPGTPDVAYSYDSVGQRLTTADGTGSSSYSYDSLRRLTAATNGAGKSVGYGYDLAGHVTTLTYPGGQQVVRGFDDAGRMTSTTDGMSSPHTTLFGYDADGNWNATTYGNNDTGTRDHNAAGQLTKLTYKQGSTTLGMLTYTRSDAGLLATATPSGGAPGVAQTLTYNARAQLTSTDSTGTTWGYDNAERITTINADTFSYDNADQLLTRTPASGPPTSYIYDERGNRTTATKTGTGTTTYGWDQANRLTSYTPAGGSASTYTYDGDGLRATKSPAGGSTQTMTWDAVTGSVALLLDDTNNRFIYGPQDTPIEQVTGSTTTYLMGDQLGSTSLATDATGAVIGTWTYDGYGSVATHTGAASSPLLFNGQYRDDESGLTYLRARYLDSSTAQFLSKDPVVSLTREAFGYADGDPVGGSDPLGLWGPKWLGTALGAVALGLGVAALVVTSEVWAPVLLVGSVIVGAAATFSDCTQGAGGGFELTATCGIGIASVGLGLAGLGLKAATAGSEGLRALDTVLGINEATLDVMALITGVAEFACQVG